MNNTSIVVITSGSDPHVERVRLHSKLPIRTFDPSLFPLSETLTYQLDGSDFIIETAQSVISNASAIWYRKPRYLQVGDLERLGVPTEYHFFALENYRKAVMSLWDLLEDKHWVSLPRNIEKGNNKLYQLKKALEVGFNVPDTIVTTAAQVVREFRSKHGVIITKCLHYPVVALKGKNHIFRTTLISLDEDLDTSGLGLTPPIFQQAIRKDYDIRVTVIGRTVFAVKILSVGQSRSAIDWKAADANGEAIYEPIDLDYSLQVKCLHLVEELGLKFGAIDLVVDDKGETYFLEINPNGQWGFIERYTNLPLAKTMANLLEQA